MAAVDGLKPLDDSRPVADGVKKYSGTLTLMGHLRFMSRLAGLLEAGNSERQAVRFQNAGGICLGENEGRWSVGWSVVPGLIHA